jgi:hypothetical protein
MSPERILMTIGEAVDRLVSEGYNPDRDDLPAWAKGKGFRQELRTLPCGEECCGQGYALVRGNDDEEEERFIPLPPLF